MYKIFIFKNTHYEIKNKNTITHIIMIRSGDIEDISSAVNTSIKSGSSESLKSTNDSIVYALFICSFDGDGYIIYEFDGIFKTKKRAFKQAKIYAESKEFIRDIEFGNPAFPSMCPENNFTICGKRSELGRFPYVDDPMGFLVEKIKIRKKLKLKQTQKTR